MSEQLAIPTVEDPKGDFLTAHGAVARLLRHFLTEAEQDFAKEVAAGSPPPPGVIEMMGVMRSAMKYYDSTILASERANPKLLLEFALSQIDLGNIDAAREAIQVLSRATDYMAQAPVPEALHSAWGVLVGLGPDWPADIAPEDSDRLEAISLIEATGLLPEVCYEKGGAKRAPV